MPSCVEDMKRFVEPKSIALFGVSRRTGDGAFNILEQLLNAGYEGEIFPVNPNASEILGVQTYKTIRDANHKGIDLGVINLPRNLVPGILGECVQARIRNVIICTQGFADANDREGKQLQQQINAFVRQGTVRIVGPNSLGTINPYLNFTSSFVVFEMNRFPVGVVCQSGVIYGVPGLTGKGIDIANACDVGFSESLEYYEQDPQVNAIVIHMEGTKDGKRFIETASRIARKKPVLVLKTARTPRAAEAAASHTGSLIGSDVVWNAAMKQSGIIRLDGLSELVDIPKFFALMPLMKGRRIAIVTASGGFGVVGIDACYRNGLEIASLKEATLRRIQAIFPKWQTPGNPIDYFPSYLVMKQPFGKVIMEGLNSALEDTNVDAVLFMGSTPSRSVYHRLCDFVTEAIPGKPPKPLAFCLFGSYRMEAKHSLESTGKAIVFESPEAAARALGYLARYSELRRRLQDNPGVDG